MPPATIPEVHEHTEPPLGQFWEPIKTDRAHRRRLAQPRSREAARRDHDRPQRARLPADLARATTRASSPPRTSTCSTTTRPTARPIEMASSASPCITTRLTTPGWSRRSRGSSTSCWRATTTSVLVTDVDEIVAPAPEWGTLGEYLDEFAEWWVNCIGYEILHLADREPPYDLGRPILDQRGLLVRERRLQQAGARDRADVLGPRLPPPHRRPAQLRPLPPPDPPAPNGLRDLPRRATRPRSDARGASATSNRDGPPTTGSTDGDEFERWFYEDSGFENDGIHIVLERIPAGWRGLF